jgi:hypothetical protein
MLCIKNTQLLPSKNISRVTTAETIAAASSGVAHLLRCHPVLLQHSWLLLLQALPPQPHALTWHVWQVSIAAVAAVIAALLHARALETCLQQANLTCASYCQYWVALAHGIPASTL